MTNLLITSLLVMPWICMPFAGISSQFRLPQMGFAILTMMAMIAMYFYKGARVQYKNKYLAMFIGWVFVTIFFTIIKGMSIEVQGRRQIGLYSLDSSISFIFIAFATWIALSYFTSEDYKRIAKAICLSSVLISWWSLMQFFNMCPFGNKAVYACANTVSACLDNPNIVANYQALAICLFIPFFDEKKYRVGFLFSVAGLACTQSEFGTLISVIGLMSYLCMTFKRWIYISISLVAVLAGVITVYFKQFKVIANDLMSGRMECWIRTMDVLHVSPMLGQGLGKFQSKPIYIKTTFWDNPHNDYIDMMISIGAIGVVLAFMVMLNTARNAVLKTPQQKAFASMFIVFIFMMLASFPLKTATVGFLGLVSFWAVESRT